MSSVSESFRLARRFGFGFRPDEPVPDDVVGWATGQLSTPAPAVGVANVELILGGSPPSAPVGPWPDKYTWSLEQRTDNMRAYLREFDQLQVDIDPSSADFVDANLALLDKYVPKNRDMVHRVDQAVFGDGPVHERFCHFWANHFTVGYLHETQNYLGHYLDAAIRGNVGGHFADMLYDVTTHPGMLTYLDNVYSIGPGSREGKRRRGNGQFADINENLGRELLELHTLSPAAGYTQDDIVAVAKVLTGWGVNAFDKNAEYPGPDYWRDSFIALHHEPGEKNVLGTTYPEGREALRLLTDDLARHEATIGHLCAKLARSFISEAPSAEDIDAVEDVWRSTDGDLPSVHALLIRRAAEQPDTPVFQQPEIWLMQVMRISGSLMFPGYEQVAFKGGVFSDTYLRDPENLLRELGQYYWSTRQPNGYSDMRSDWVSPEHLERRLRYAQQAYLAGGAGVAQPDALMDRMQVSKVTRGLVGRADSPDAKYAMLFCSPEMMEA